MMKCSSFFISAVILLFAVGCVNGGEGLPNAVESDNVSSTQKYLVDGADPNQGDSLNRPLIITAIVNGNAEIVRLLLSNGANPNSTVDGIPAILLASAEKGCSEDILKILIAAGVDPDTVDPVTATTPLLEAAANGNLYCFDALVNAGADINVIDVTKANVVFRAAESGNSEILSRLIDLGVDLNQKAVQGVTPIMVASYAGHIDFVEMLLDGGMIDVCLADIRGRTARDMALEGGYPNLAQILPDCPNKQSETDHVLAK